MSNTVHIDKYISKITWDRAVGYIYVYDKKGDILWGVAEGPDFNNYDVILKRKKVLR